MIKKSIAFILIAALCILTACSNGGAAAGDIVSPVVTEERPELVIQINSNEYEMLKIDKVWQEYIRNFKSQMGVNIKFDILDLSFGSNELEEKNEFMKNLAFKLYTNNGPDIIFTEYFFFQEVIEQGAVAEVSDKIPNIGKVYPELLNDKVYYVPIGMHYYCRGLNSKVLQDLKIPTPEFDWTRSDYYSMLDKRSSNINIDFNPVEYENVISRYIISKIDLKIEDKKLSINIPEAIDGINQAREEIFNGNYIVNQDYTYKNYYNMLYEENSKEHAAGSELIDSTADSRIWVSMVNGFRAEDIAEETAEGTITAMPEFSDSRPYIRTRGLLVNKNSQHLELAYEFINGLLNDEVQLALFEEGAYYNYYPVNKDIEDEIRKIEAQRVTDQYAIKLKEYVLQELKSGDFDTVEDFNQEIFDIEVMFYRDLSRYILADKPYSSEVLDKELKALVDKYNIYLNE